MDDGSATQMVRAVIAGGPELVRRGIRDVLAGDRRFQIVAEVARPDDLAETYQRSLPDVVFLGLGRDDGTERAAGLAALTAILRRDRFARALVLVETDTPGDVLEPLRAGASGIVLRDAPASTLLQAARDVLEGGAALDPVLTRSLFSHLAAGLGAPDAKPSDARLDPAILRLLSAREQDVLRSLALGYRNKEIAGQLGVSVGTVKTHLRHIFRKLGVADRTTAVLAALRLRLAEAA